MIGDIRVANPVGMSYSHNDSFLSDTLSKISIIYLCRAKISH